MKIDYDLIRKILVAAEEHCDYVHPVESDKLIEYIPGYDKITIFYHIKYLAEARYIQLALTDAEFAISDISRQGRAYLDSIRDDAKWKAVQKSVLEKVGALSLDAIKIAGEFILKQYFS